jgi:hypothetical protein
VCDTTDWIGHSYYVPWFNNRGSEVGNHSTINFVNMIHLPDLDEESAQPFVALKHGWSAPDKFYLISKAIVGGVFK